MPCCARCAAAVMPPMPAPIIIAEGVFVVMPAPHFQPAYAASASSCLIRRAASCVLDTQVEYNSSHAQSCSIQPQIEQYTHNPPAENASSVSVPDSAALPGSNRVPV